MLYIENKAWLKKCLALFVKHKCNFLETGVISNLAQKPPGTAAVTFFLSSPLCTLSAHSWLALLSHPTRQNHWAHLFSNFLCVFLCSHYWLLLTSFIHFVKLLLSYETPGGHVLLLHAPWLLTTLLSLWQHGHYSPTQFDSVLTPCWWGDLPTLPKTVQSLLVSINSPT